MNRWHHIFLLLVAPGFLLPLSAYAQQLREAPSEPTPPIATSSPTDPTYVIGPQDTLAVNVWKEPELSENVQVRPDGKVSIPLLDDVQAAGLTAMKLSSDITAGLKKYVAAPRVTVLVTGINSRRFYVLGEVLHAGTFTLLPDMNVLQAISNAGGLTPYANGKKIYVLRNEAGKQVKYRFNYNKVLKGQNSQDNFPLMSGDTVVVP